MQDRRGSDSQASLLASLPIETREKLLASFTDEEIEHLLLDWLFVARENQLPPELFGIDVKDWLLLAGRGFGKTRTGASYVNWRVENNLSGRIGLIARTAADIRDVVVEGDSGILRTAKPWNRPLYEPSKKRLTWNNGATATTFSAEEPESLRGPQHDLIWGDELASWKYIEAFDNAQLGLRIGKDGRKPKAVYTTTPKPVKIITNLVNDPRVLVTSGNTYDNSANLAESFLDYVTAKYGKSRLGLQELFAQILTDTPGALWTLGRLQNLRVDTVPQLSRIVIGVDPEATSNKDSAETGIIVGGKSYNSHYYTLDDCSVRGTPEIWAKAVISAYEKWRADAVIVETNNGGEMCERVLRTVPGGEHIKIIPIRASKGKYTRAEPVSMLAVNGVHHQVGYFGDLESQLCTYVPGNDSPDRLDAYVWCFSELAGLLEDIPEPVKQNNIFDINKRK